MLLDIIFPTRSTLLASYFGIEIAFYCAFHLYLLPSANKLVDVHPYRDYHIGQRHRIILRCLERLVRHTAEGQNKEEAIRSYLLSWFHENRAVVDISRFLIREDEKKRLLSRRVSDVSNFTSATEEESFSVSSDGSYTCGKQRWTIEELGRADMDELFAWAAFAKDFVHLNSTELADLEQTFVGCEEKFGLYFREGTTKKYTAKRLNLEDIKAFHRPLIVYLFVLFIRVISGLCLLSFGFRPCCSKSGLQGWFRSSRNETTNLPLMFFHGVAPGGLAFYLPMVLKGLTNDDQAVFLFENPAISTDLFAGFNPLSEQQTLDSIQELFKRFTPDCKEFAVVGHSFGTVPVTWLLHCPKLRNMIRQAVLLDPVTILLTTPDVMNSFLYSTKNSKVRLVADELLVQNYIRRHFPYYNSDLWIEDLPSENMQMLVCISENDDVIDARKVRQECERHLQRQDRSVIFWEESRHGDCVLQTQKWKDVKSWMVNHDSRRINVKRPLVQKK